ncbi:hypothetical protein DFP74_1813 [Nocardiopsis sp. Huas11]|uniref:hypothetical protein n=1 Tax=Nocardiopsis sp. Huas11 TaxID=2183912 RepID=UPI000EAD1C69|nr:hypothetical protein [Nocardiopsis sp. Huas11]RKS06189.1 hypothetical protein DFP74_1813 [Nocardiopsis sp. Huas11]
MEQENVEGWVTESLQGVIERMFGLLIDSGARGPVWGEYQGSPTSTQTVIDQGVLQLQNVFNPLVLFLATLGILLAAARLLWTRRLDPMIDLIRGLLTVIVATFGGLFLIYVLSQFSSAFTSMILGAGTYRAPYDNGSGLDREVNFLYAAQEVYPSIMRVGVVNDLGFGDNEISRGAVSSMVGLAVILGVIAQMVVLTLLDAIIYLIACLLPLAAASAMIPNLKLLPKVIGWLFACLLYKPLLLMIYLSGLVILATADDYGTDGEDGLLRYLLGAAIMLLATGALPVLMKLMSSGSMWAMAFLAGGVNSVTGGGGGGGGGNSSGSSTSADSASTNAQSNSSSADSGSANAQQAAAGANERAAGVSRNLDGGGTDTGGDAAAVTAASAAGTGTGAAGTSPLGTQGQFAGLDGGGTDGAANPAGGAADGGTNGAANPAGGAADGGAPGATEVTSSTVSGSEQSSSQTVASGADDVAGGADAGGGFSSAGDGGGTAPGPDSPGGAVMVSDGGGGAYDGGGAVSGGGAGAPPTGAGSDSLADGADGRMV